jgi:hypothetical protein
MDVFGGGSKTSTGTTVLQVTGVLLVVAGLPLLGEYLFTPNWRYIVAPEAPKVEVDIANHETTHWGGTNPRYVFEIEKFLAETDSTVTIPWQGKAVTLPKSEITIEKHEKGYRITVPARLLK